MIRKKELHSELQDEECLSSLEKNVDEHFEKELTPWWTIMLSLHEELRKTEGRSNEKKENLKTQGESL